MDQIVLIIHKYQDHTFKLTILTWPNQKNKFYIMQCLYQRHYNQQHWGWKQVVFNVLATQMPVKIGDTQRWSIWMKTLFKNHVFWESQILRITDFENHGFWESLILRITDFENHGFWVSRILRITDFENHGFWESRILRISDLDYCSF